MNGRNVLIAAAIASMSMAGAAVAAIAPYSNNFNSNDATEFSDPFDIYTASGGAYNVATGGTTVTPNDALTSSLIQLTNVSGGSFTMTSTFNIASSTGQGTVGLAALASNDTLTGSYYQAYASRAGTHDTLVLEEVGGDGQINASTLTMTVTELPLDTTLIFTLSATMNGGTLMLSFTVSDPASSYTQTLTGSDTTPLTGEYFGYRTTRTSGPTNAMMDDFAVTLVPEPATGALCLVAMGLAVRRRHRR